MIPYHPSAEAALLCPTPWLCPLSPSCSHLPHQLLMAVTPHATNAISAPNDWPWPDQYQTLALQFQCGCVAGGGGGGLLSPCHPAVMPPCVALWIPHKPPLMARSHPTWSLPGTRGPDPWSPTNYSPAISALVSREGHNKGCDWAEIRWGAWVAVSSCLIPIKSQPPDRECWVLAHDICIYGYVLCFPPILLHL